MLVRAPRRRLPERARDRRVAGAGHGVPRRRLPRDVYYPAVSLLALLTEVPRPGQLRNEAKTGGDVFDNYSARCRLQARPRFQGGDFFADTLPAVDVLVLGSVSHDRSVDERRALLTRAHAALPADGAVPLYETIVDDDRRTYAFGRAMSPDMLIETPAGGDSTSADRATWLR